MMIDVKIELPGRGGDHLGRLDLGFLDRLFDRISHVLAVDRRIRLHAAGRQRHAAVGHQLRLARAVLKLQHLDAGAGNIESEEIFLL
ncbi:MAG: hypothetical protein WKG07_23785 [Hymenobacter sp.]